MIVDERKLLSAELIEGPDNLKLFEQKREA